MVHNAAFMTMKDLEKLMARVALEIEDLEQKIDTCNEQARVMIQVKTARKEDLRNIAHWYRIRHAEVEALKDH